MFDNGGAVRTARGKGEFRSGQVQVGLLTTLALLSGCCGLAYEVLYVRALTSILGDMFYVHAALLSTFLVGIGLGAKVAHRWLRWLWVFEILTGLYALGLPTLSRWFSQLPIMTPITSSPSLTIFLTIAFISLPSLLIGFSIPLFSAYIKAYNPQRLSFQWIYRVYNLGAFLSILGVELILIRWVGISSSLGIIGAINLFNGLVLVLMRLAPAGRPAESPRSFPRRNIIGLGLASLGSAVFQMFFLKLSYLVFYPHRENFAIGLSVTILGIFLGAWLASKVRVRFETLLVLAAVLVGLIYVNYLPILRLFEVTVSWARSSELLVIVHKFAFGCLFALGPMVLFGALIPALMRTESEVAGESGHLLWVSSLANATGYLVYVLVGHPLLSNNILLALIAGIMLLASLVSSGLRWSKIEGALAACSIILIVLLTLGWEERNFYLAHWASKLKGEDEVTVFKSGAESATLVRTNRVFKSEDERATLIRDQTYEDVWEDVWISYNGHPSITVRRNGVANYAEITVGIISGLTSPRLGRALVIGFGTGVTAGSTSCVFKATDVVEINNAFYKMMPSLRYANFDIEHNRRATLHLTDGRAFLVGKEGVYDAIVSTVSAPTYFSASKIYTVEFYKAVRKSLKPDGVFCASMSVPWMPASGVMTILSALRHSFRYSEIRLIRGNYYLLTCSNQPVRSRRQFSELLPANHTLTSQLQLALSNFDLDEYFEDILLSENIFDHFTPVVPQENTDDHPVLEFMMVRNYQMGKMGEDPFLENQGLLNIKPVRRGEVDDPGRLARKAAVFWRLGPGFFKNFSKILTTDPDVAPEFFLQSAAHVAAQGKADEAINLLTTALEIRPNWAEAHNNLGTVLQSQGKLDEANRSYRKALQFKPGFAQAHNNLGNTLASEGKPDEAIQTFEEALVYNEKSDSKSNMADIHFSLAMVLKKSNKAQQAWQEFAKAVEGYRKKITTNSISIEMLVRLGTGLVETGDLNEATKYHQQAVEMNPYDMKNQSTLAETLVLQGRYDEAAVRLKKALRLISHTALKEDIANLQEFLELIELEKSKQER